MLRIYVKKKQYRNLNYMNIENIQQIIDNIHVSSSCPRLNKVENSLQEPWRGDVGRMGE